MENYYFKKLNDEEKWEERNKIWVKSDPEKYVRLLIVNDLVDILKKYEKEDVNFDFSYQIKDQILLTLAMEKQSLEMIYYLLDKGLKIKERDIIGLIKNAREEESNDKIIKVLDKVNISEVDMNNVLIGLKDYYLETSLERFLEYLLEKEVEIKEEILTNFNRYDNLEFILKKIKIKKDFDKMNNKYEDKNIKTKMKKI